MPYDSDFEKIMQKCKKRLTRAKAIKIYCKELCSNGDTTSWSDCIFTNCPLWRFRRGKEILTTGSPLTSSSAKKLRKMRCFSAENSVQEQVSEGQEVRE
jgi:hypothetical protein